MTLPLLVSWSPHITQTNMETARYPNFAAFLDAYVERRPPWPSSKSAAPCWSPAVFDGTRRRANVRSIGGLICLDVDHLSLEPAAPFLDAHAHFIVPSFSLKGAHIILPLSHPVEPEQWDGVWTAVNEACGALADTATRDASRAFYISPHTAISVVPDAPPIDVDAFRPTSLPHPPPSPSFSPRLRADEIIARLRRYVGNGMQNEQRAAIFRRIKDAIQTGAPLADEGDRNNVAFHVAHGWLGWCFPEQDADHLASFFRESIDLLGDDAVTFPRFIEMIKKGQEKKREHTKKKEEEKQAKLSAYYGNDVPVVDKSDFDERPIDSWLVCHGNSVYFYDIQSGDYSSPATTRIEQISAMKTTLAPVRDYIPLARVSKSGAVTPEKIENIIYQFGRRVDDVEYSWIHERSELNCTRLTVACKPRDIEPRYDEQIARWLHALADFDEERHTILLDWLADFPRLDRALAVLALIGARGVGKSMLSAGLARIWTTRGYTPWENIARFTSDLLHCPFVVADEVFDKKNNEFRKLISIRTHNITEKYKNSRTMLGYVRLLVSANTMDDVIKYSANMSQDAAEAIAARIRYFEVTEEARSFLSNVDTYAWVEGDRIAAHVLYLEKTRPVERGAQDRFGTGAELSNSMVNGITLNAQMTGNIANFLVGFLAKGNIEQNRNRIFIEKGEVWIQAKLIQEEWSNVIRNVQAPEMNGILSALNSLSYNQRGERKGARRYKMRHIRPDLLQDQASREGYTEEEWHTILMQAEEKRNRALN